MVFNLTSEDVELAGITKPLGEPQRREHVPRAVHREAVANAHAGSSGHILAGHPVAAERTRSRRPGYHSAGSKSRVNSDDSVRLTGMTIIRRHGPNHTR